MLVEKPQEPKFYCDSRTDENRQSSMLLQGSRGQSSADPGCKPPEAGCFWLSEHGKVSGRSASISETQYFLFSASLYEM